MDYNTEHTIVVIATANRCPFCDEMRGMPRFDQQGVVRKETLNRGNGWPSVKNPMMIPPKMNHRWDTQFFKSLLTGGQNDSKQRVEVLEIHYDVVFNTTSDSLSEFSIFSLNKSGKLLVKKFIRTDKGMAHATFVEGMDLSEIKWIKDSEDFVKYRNLWIPVEDIRDFQPRTYPNISYFSSTIWYSAIMNNTSLYAYIPGYKIVRQPHNHEKYMVFPAAPNESEDIFDPIEVSQTLLKDPQLLHYPSDHGKIQMRILN